MLRFCLLFAVAFGLAPLITVDKPVDRDGLRQYLVRLTPDAPTFRLDIEKLRNWVKQEIPVVDTSKIDDVWSIGNFTGFPVWTSPEGVRHLRADRFVRYIEEGAVITLEPMEMTPPAAPETGAAFTTRVDWGQLRATEIGLDLTTTPAGLYSNPSNTSTYPSGSSDTTVWDWNGPTFKVPTDGSGAYVWVEDTGINFAHQEFLDSTGKSRVTNMQDFTAERNPPPEGDGNGHGTHCAGTIAGNYRGIAKGALLGSLRVLNSQGSGTTGWVVSGMNYAANNQVDGLFNILSMSLGGGLSTTINDAADATFDAGVSVIVAAGNNGASACNYSPASAPSAITVCATDAGDQRASWSNYGTCTDVFAPGVQIHSAWIGGTTAYNTISGTSMATPIVAGSVAVYATANPGRTTPSGVTSAIKSDATPGIVKDAQGSPNLMIYAQW